MDKNKIKYSHPVPPFVRYCSAIIPTMFDDSLSYYEALCALNNFIQKNIVEIINNNAAISDSLIKQFEELKEFVDHYFDNLDVQEEINNKLDEMTADGTLEEIIGHYIQNPATTTTLGTVKVGNGLSMDENNRLNVNVGDGLEIDNNTIKLPEAVQFLNVEPITFRYTKQNPNCITNTDIQYCIIPKSVATPKIAISDPDNVNIRDIASPVNARVKATVMINAGTWNEDTELTDGAFIYNHEVLRPNTLSAARQLLTISDDGTLGSVSSSENPNTLAEEYKYVIPGFYTLYANGVDYSQSHDADSMQPRTFIAQDVAGNYLIGVCSGRGIDDNTGMSLQNIVDFLFNSIHFNPTFVYDLDGGHSTQMMYRGIRQNAMTNNSDRACTNWIYFASETANDEGLFESLTTTNEKLVNIEKNFRNVESWTDEKLSALIIPESGLSVSNNSIVRNIGGTLIDLHIRFIVASGTTIPAYSYLLGGLPKTFRPGLRYTMFKTTNDEYASEHVVYTAHDDTTGELKIRNRSALSEGEYTLHMTYPIGL